MTKCARCDWRPTTEHFLPPREQLAEHARAAGHPLCICGPHSLAHHEHQTCERCLTRTREHLAGIVTMWAELPSHMRPRGTGLDRGTPSAPDGQPLPGGDALVLHVDGGVGYAHDGDVHRDTDPPSVAHALASWEDDWRHTRGEPAAVVDGGRGGVGPTLRQAWGYLERMTRWAANSHPAFDEYANDLAQLHARLEQVTGRSQRRVIAEADCFECGGDLERLAIPGDRCKHGPPPSSALPLIDGQPIEVRRAARDVALTEWERQHGNCKQGGYEDHWTCVRCGRRYEWESYLLALRARLEEAS